MYWIGISATDLVMSKSGVIMTHFVRFDSTSHPALDADVLCTRFSCPIRLQTGGRGIRRTPKEGLEDDSDRSPQD